jgi:hypothetical protein
MLFFRMTFYPSGRVDSERLNPDDLDPEVVAPFRPLFATGLSFNSTMPHVPEVAVKWTGAEHGQALFACSFRGELFLSGVLVAGWDDVGDAELLQMFTRSLESSELVRQITRGTPNPYRALLERSERPLLGAVVWPTLSAETFDQIAGLDLLLSTVFLQRIANHLDAADT